jgi:hypothetical protein
MFDSWLDLAGTLVIFAISFSATVMIREEINARRRLKFYRKLRDEDIARETAARARVSKDRRDQKIIETAQEFYREESL